MRISESSNYFNFCIRRFEKYNEIGINKEKTQKFDWKKIDIINASK